VVASAPVTRGPNGDIAAFPALPPIHANLTLALPSTADEPVPGAGPVVRPRTPPDDRPMSGSGAKPPPLRPRRGLPPDGADAPSAWWSRAGTGSAPVLKLAPTGPPAVPITGGVNARGLPMRVPMAQLPEANTATGRAQVVPAPRDEPDPETTGNLLSRFYGGVRRAESEETTELHRGNPRPADR
jgi:hypothetical protein